MSFQSWIARKLAPDTFRKAERYERMRYEIGSDRHWLAADFPEVYAFADRALARDVNHWRGLDEPEEPSPWHWDISQFREQLRRMKAEAAVPATSDGADLEVAREERSREDERDRLYAMLVKLAHATDQQCRVLLRNERRLLSEEGAMLPADRAALRRRREDETGSKNGGGT